MPLTLKLILKALGLTIITFGSSHLLVAYTLMIVRDYNEGNLFRILNFNSLFPGIDLGWQSLIVSNVIAISTYLFVLGVIMWRDRKYANKEDRLNKA
ncbi:MAG: hypothetical protein WAW80_04230 [Candidatus Saccharimonadales bacterium]